MAPPIAEALLGRTLVGRYRLDAPLGRGGYGVVYSARDLLLDREVAVKVFAPRAERDDARFLREARIAARVDHPGVVRVFDLGRDDATGCAFMAQELVRGPTLRDWLEEHLVATPAQAMALLGPVMEGLAAAHARGVIHRDVKPENVVLAEGRDGVVAPKLIDFGVASLVEPGEASPGAGRGVAGTPAYMAPEQARGEGEPDPRTDVWAVGVMLYELLLGRRPYDADGTRALVAALAHAEPVRFARRVPAASAALCAVVERALSPAPADRFPGVDAMREALARCAEVSAPDAPWSPSALAVSTRTTREAVPPAPSSPAPRPAARWLVAVAVFAALAAVGVTGARLGRTASPVVRAPSPTKPSRVIAAPTASGPVAASATPAPPPVAPPTARAIDPRPRPRRREPAAVVGVNQAPVLAPPGVD